MDEIFDVFLSYSRDDAAKAALVRDRLQSLGLNVFFDSEGIDAGAEFPIVIDRAVKSARCVLGLWSHSAFESRWVRIESRIGLDQRKLVAAVIQDIPPEELPAEFYNVNIENLSDFTGQDDHRGWANIVRAIGKRVGRSDLAGRPVPPAKASPSANQYKPYRSRNSSPIGAILGIAALVAVLAIGGFVFLNQQNNNRAGNDRDSILEAVDALVKENTEDSRLAARAQGACEAGEAQACRTFIQNFPDRDFASRARDKLEELSRPVAANLSGNWNGYYVQSGRRTRFSATLTGESGAFSGRMSEPAGFGDGSTRTLYSTLSGRTNVDGDVMFTKRYDGTGGVRHAVNYEGRIDGDTIAGTWRVDSLSGQFIMERN